jgi:hypothetical protein
MTRPPDALAPAPDLAHETENKLFCDWFARVPYEGSPALAAKKGWMARAGLSASPVSQAPAPLGRFDLHAFLVRFMQNSEAVAVADSTGKMYADEATEYLVDEELLGVPVYVAIEGEAVPVEGKGPGGVARDVELERGDLRQIETALHTALAAVWDGHYSGKGVTTEYAQAVDSEVKAAIKLIQGGFAPLPDASRQEEGEGKA